MLDSRPVEYLAVALGLINVTLIIKRSIWNYPFGIVMVCLYAYIFYDYKLYSDSLLQIYFFFMQAYGWWYWAKGKADKGEVVVRRLPVSHYWIYGACLVGGVAFLGTIMDRFTDAAVPYPDATIAVLSLIAQFLMARRYLENWLFWIATDIIAVGVYWYKDLTPTAALYAVFLVLATIGFFEWRRNHRAQKL